MSEIPSTPPEGTPGVPPSGPITPNPGMPNDYSPPVAGGMPYVGPPPTQDEKTMGMLAHLLGIPTGFVGPLIIWMIKKDQSPFVNDQGREALNFHLTLLIGWLAGWLLNFFFCIGVILWLGIGIASLVFGIIATMKAKDGVAYRYPFAIRFIK